MRKVDFLIRTNEKLGSHKITLKDLTILLTLSKKMKPMNAKSISASTGMSAIYTNIKRLERLKYIYYSQKIDRHYMLSIDGENLLKEIID